MQKEMYVAKVEPKEAVNHPDHYKVGDYECLDVMISLYGMTDNYGMLNLHKLHMGNDLILKEASKISKEMEEVCIKMLSKHRYELEKIVELLLENETIYDKDMKFIKSREQISNFIRK